MLDVRRREDGADVYPALRAAAANAPAGLDPLTMDHFRVFGYCPVPGDTHLAEYLPWTHDPVSKPWERYEIPLYDWGGNEMFREFSHHRLAQMASGALSVEGMRGAISEGAVEIVEGIVGNCNRYDEAVNVPNRGAIANLPPDDRRAAGRDRRRRRSTPARGATAARHRRAYAGARRPW